MSTSLFKPVPLAQWIARWTSNPKVLGSTPRWDDAVYIFLLFPSWLDWEILNGNSKTLTFQVLDLLDVVGEAAAGQDEEELDEGDDEGDEGADEEQREDVAEEDAADGRHATLSVDHVRHRGDRRRSLERRLRRQKDLKSVLGTRRQCRSQQF